MDKRSTTLYAKSPSDILSSKGDYQMSADGVVIKNVAGVYREASTDSEQVTQAVMGQSVRVLEDRNDWLHIETWDTYTGWIQSRWISRNIPYPQNAILISSLFTDALKAPDPNSDILTKLVIITRLELISQENEWANVRLPDGREAWVQSKDIRQDVRISGITGEDIIRTAKRFMGVPYLWGGTTPFGIDCSGFTQLVYKINGIDLLRDAYMQAGDPRATLVDKTDLSSGDLVFFAKKDDKSKITHVGLSLGDGRFIHSAGGVGVTINRLDDEKYDNIYWGTRRMELNGTST